MGIPWEDGTDDYYDRRLRNELQRAQTGEWGQLALGAVTGYTVKTLTKWRQNRSGLRDLTGTQGEGFVPGTQWPADGKRVAFTVMGAVTGLEYYWSASRTGTFGAGLPLEGSVRGNLVPEDYPGSLRSQRAGELTPGR